MSQKVFLHIGAPKTGTTYLQDRLTRNASSLAAHDIHYPTRSPFVSPGLFHFRAALDLLGQDWGGPAGHAEGSWDALVRRVRRRSGTVIVSHEILAPAKPHVVERAFADLDDAEVHVVYSARDLARQLPAAWQESIKQGRRWSYKKFLRKARQGKLWFARAFDLPSVLGTWGAHVPPDHVHLITLPQAGGPRDALWTRFCSVVGIDPAWAPEDSDRANASLGVAETAVIRQLNKRLDRKTRREQAFDHLIREMLAQEQLVGRRSQPVRLPPASFDWVRERGEQWREWVTQSGIHVVGDVDELLPVPEDPDAKWHDPDNVRARKRASVALDALAAMTQEAASRPDPDRGLVRRIRER